MGGLAATAGCMETIREIIDEAEEAEASFRVEGGPDSATVHVEAGGLVDVWVSRIDEGVGDTGSVTLEGPGGEVVDSKEFDTDEFSETLSFTAAETGDHVVTVDPGRDDQVRLNVAVFVPTDDD